MSSTNHNIIFYSGSRDKTFCGYCKTENASYSNGMWTSSLTVQAYQDLIDRGWRRSGKYCYKPSMDVTCCPLYAIRCDALEFKLSKSQKKIIKRVSKFLKSGECEKNLVDIEEPEREPIMEYKLHDHNDKMQVTDIDSSVVEKQSPSFTNCSQNSSLVHNKDDNNLVVSVNLNRNPETKNVKPGEGPDPNLPKCRKKKLLRIEKKLAKNPNFNIKTSTSQQISLEDLIAENDSVYTDESKKLKIKLLKLTPSSSSFEAEYAVYKLYQNIVHGDTDDRCTREQFIRFLVTSPLRAAKADHPDHPGYGSFHQQYWIGNKLIAVGVLDILPKCVSSVYLFYDPDYYHMVLGTYSSLREICLVRQLNSISSDLKYYYMGFYIHSCCKMRYKGKFRPSYLLCPLRYTWHEIDKCIQKLDNEKYSIFNESEDIQEDNTLKIENIPVLYSGTQMTYSMYKRMRNLENEDDKIITEYKTLVGSKLATQLIYCFLD